MTGDGTLQVLAAITRYTPLVAPSQGVLDSSILARVANASVGLQRRFTQADDRFMRPVAVGLHVLLPCDGQFILHRRKRFRSNVGIMPGALQAIAQQIHTR